jgi:hypothetical protein
MLACKLGMQLPAMVVILSYRAVVVVVRAQVALFVLHRQACRRDPVVTLVFLLEPVLQLLQVIFQSKQAPRKLQALEESRSNPVLRKERVVQLHFPSEADAAAQEAQSP